MKFSASIQNEFQLIGRTLRTVAVLVACNSIFVPKTAMAHVGSQDIYFAGQAGPYKVNVTIRPPLAIPGIAKVDVFIPASLNVVDQIQITPQPMTGEGAKHPPNGDVLLPSSQNQQLFTGTFWIMTSGAWQLNLELKGSSGTGAIAIPVPSMALTVQKMSRGLGILLIGSGFVVVVGLIGIVAAAASEALVVVGGRLTARQRRNGWLAGAITVIVLVGTLCLGKIWWNVEAANYSNTLYKPLQIRASLENSRFSSPGLELQLMDPGWIPVSNDFTSQRELDDLVPDHGHIMHLFLIRKPKMDVFYHLHPSETGTGTFSLTPLILKMGEYEVYADIVHINGFSETAVGTLTVPSDISSSHSNILQGDDSMAMVPTKAAADLDHGTSCVSTQQLADGYKMVFERPAMLVPGALSEFKFKLLDPTGRPPKDMSLYMGMLGHAAFVKDDGTVFAHIHPSGTVAMAAFDLANSQAASSELRRMTEMSGMQMNMQSAQNTNEVSFPYGLPTPGHYRVLVQMKHSTVIESAVWDVVTN